MRGRHTEVVAEELDDMLDEEPPVRVEDVRPRSKHGAGRLLPGSSAEITLSLEKKQVTRIDWLAAEIRAGAGIWITRSAILTAFIEAALRSEPLWEVLISQSRRVRTPSLMVRSQEQPEEGRGRAGKRVLKMAKYLLRTRSRHFKRDDGF